jgi:exodeoxyribonuclease-1
MAVQLADLLGKWSPAVFIGHNTIRFDEAFLRQLFYQNLLPIYLTNTRGNSRADTLVMARALADARPGSFIIPNNGAGKPTFKLEHLAPANGFGAFKAHDALADVEATVFLAKLLRDADPELFDHFVDMGSRHNAESLLRTEVPIFQYYSVEGIRELLPLGALVDLSSEHGRVVALDLSIDVADLFHIDFQNYETLASLRIGGRQVIRKIATNRSPTIIPRRLGAEVDDDACQTWCQKLAAIKDNELFLRRLREFMLRIQPEYQRSEQIEERIFDGFPSRSDEVLLEQFHRISWADRWKLLRDFDDGRWKSLGQRLIAEHAPEVLPDDVVSKYHEWVSARLAEREIAENEQ